MAALNENLRAFWRLMNNDKHKSHDDMIGFQVCDLVDDMVCVGERWGAQVRLDLMVRLKLPQFGIFDLCDLADFFVLLSTEAKER